jgi:hypothetical protein
MDEHGMRKAKVAARPNCHLSLYVGGAMHMKAIAPRRFEKVKSWSIRKKHMLLNYSLYRFAI